MIESPYNHIYGRLPLPTRGYIPQQRAMYIGEWDWTVFWDDKAILMIEILLKYV